MRMRRRTRQQQSQYDSLVKKGQRYAWWRGGKTRKMKKRRNEMKTTRKGRQGGNVASETRDDSQRGV